MARQSTKTKSSSEVTNPEEASLPPVEPHRKPSESGPTSQRTPAFATRYGRVEAAVWARELEDGRSVYSVTLHRNYQDKEGQWHRTATMDEHDLLPAAKALDESYVWIQKQRQAARQPS